MHLFSTTLRSALRTTAAVAATALMAVTAGAAPPDAKSGKTAARVAPASDVSPTSAPARGKLLFVVTTGLDDIQTMNGSLKHSRVAKETGRLEDVAWLAYGRGVQAVAGNITARPEKTAELARAAQKSGVRLIVCKNALDHMGIPEEKLDPKVEIVPNGAIALAEFVSQGYTVISY